MLIAPATKPPEPIVAYDELASCFKTEASALHYQKSENRLKQTERHQKVARKDEKRNMLYWRHEIQIEDTNHGYHD